MVAVVVVGVVAVANARGTASAVPVAAKPDAACAAVRILRRILILSLDNFHPGSFLNNAFGKSFR